MLMDLKVIKTQLRVKNLRFTPCVIIGKLHHKKRKHGDMHTFQKV